MYVLESQVCSYCLNIGQDQLNVALTMHKLSIGKLLSIGKYQFGLKNLYQFSKVKDQLNRE